MVVKVHMLTMKTGCRNETRILIFVLCLKFGKQLIAFQVNSRNTIQLMKFSTKEWTLVEIHFWISFTSNRFCEHHFPGLKRFFNYSCHFYSKNSTGLFFKFAYLDLEFEMLFLKCIDYFHLDHFPNEWKFSMNFNSILLLVSPSLSLSLFNL